MDETHEIGFVNGGVCLNRNVRNNSNGKNSSQGKRSEFPKSCGKLSSRISRLSLNIQDTDADKNADLQITLVGNSSIAQKLGARDEYCYCKDFVDESCLDETPEIVSVKEGFLSKLFQCKFLKSRAFTLIEIMVVVSVLGILGMSLHNTIQKVLYDYEAYGALNFFKRLREAQTNAYLVCKDEDIGVIREANAWIILGLVFGSSSLSKYFTEMLLPESLEPFLPKDMVKGKSDFMKFFNDPDIDDLLTVDKEVAKNAKGIQLNFFKGVDFASIWNNNFTMLGIDEKLIPFFEKQGIKTGKFEDGTCVAGCIIGTLELGYGF